MRRALRGAVGVVLAVAAVVPTPLASAKFPALLRRSKRPPIQTVDYEENIVLSEGHHRLEEMKVELALLSDIATFPCYLGARAAGEILELRGYVPNDLVRKRALELARRNTFLTVNDAMRIQTNLSVRPPLRPARVLQQEGAELLQAKMGERAKQMALGVRANGAIVVTGPIDSVESKLAVSRLFRQLPGCFSVVNAMTVQQIARDGQRVVRVTRDASVVVPPSALGLEPEQAGAPSPTLPMPAMAAPTTVAPTLTAPEPSVLMPAPVPEVPQPKKKPSAPAVPRPTILPSSPSTNSLDALKEDLRLPISVPPKPVNTPTKPDPIKMGRAPDDLKPAKLPVKWGQPAMSWESQVKKLEPINASATPPSRRKSTEEAKMPTPIRMTNQPEMPRPTRTPPLLSANPVAPRLSREEVKMPTPIAPSQPAETKKPHDSSVESKPRKPSPKSSLVFAESRVAPTPAMTWRRPGSEEQSEPKAPAATNATDVLSSAPAKPAPTPAAAPASSSNRWPPAYAPENKGRPGVIIFDEDPPPTKPVPAAIGTFRPIVPANLQRQIKSICGRKARDVVVETQPDGIVLVKVKVPNLTVEDQLTRKILAIPEMTYPQVRLRMDVGP
ncbi:MAG: hypothetical protein ACRELG_25830 [Gemmataceae bacterium]